MYSIQTSSVTLPLLATQYPRPTSAAPNSVCAECLSPRDPMPPKGVGFTDPLSGTLNFKLTLPTAWKWALLIATVTKRDDRPFWLSR